MTHLLQILFDGLGSGAGYVLVGLGFSMVFGVLGVLNVAQADFYMVGAYVSYAVLTAVGAQLALGLATAALTGLAIGVIFYLVVVRRVRQDQQLAIFVATLGLSMFLQNVVARLAGPDQRPFPQLIAQRNYDVAGVILPRPTVVLIAATLAMAVALIVWLHRSRAGSEVRAVAQSRFLGAAIGIDVRRTMIIAVVISCVVATTGGVLIGNSLSTITPFIATNLGLKMFIVVLVAGAGSVAGVIVVGFGLGIAESFTVAYISSQWQDMAGLLALVLVLLLRPEGVFGQRARVG
jgi:branched-chain amino acid transport system permease protein